MRFKESLKTASRVFVRVVGALSRLVGTSVKLAYINVCLGSGGGMLVALPLGLLLGFIFTLSVNSTLTQNLDTAFKPSVGQAIRKNVPGTTEFTYTERLSTSEFGRPVGTRIPTGRDASVLSSAELIVHKKQRPGDAANESGPLKHMPVFAIQMNEELRHGGDAGAAERELVIDFCVWTAAGEMLTVDEWWIREGAECNEIVRLATDWWGYQTLSSPLGRETIEYFLRFKAADYFTGMTDERLLLTRNEYQNDLADFVSARVDRSLAAVGTGSSKGLAMSIIGGPFQALIIGLAMAGCLLLAFPLPLLFMRKFHSGADWLWQLSAQPSVIAAKLNLTRTCSHLGLLGTVLGLVAGLAGGADLVLAIGFALITTLVASFATVVTDVLRSLVTNYFFFWRVPDKDEGDETVEVGSESAVQASQDLEHDVADPDPHSAHAIMNMTEPDFAVARTSAPDIMRRAGLSRYMTVGGMKLLEERGVIRRDVRRGRQGTYCEFLIGRPDGMSPSLNGHLKHNRFSNAAYRIHAILCEVAREQDWRPAPLELIAKEWDVNPTEARKLIGALEDKSEIEVFRSAFSFTPTRVRLKD